MLRMQASLQRLQVSSLPSPPCPGFVEERSHRFQGPDVGADHLSRCSSLAADRWSKMLEPLDMLMYHSDWVSWK